MNKQEILSRLQDSHHEFINYLSSLDDRAFMHSYQNEKWTAGQQADHIYRSLMPVHLILVLLFGLVILFVIKNLYLLWTVYFQNKFFYRISQLLIEHQIFKFYKTNYLNIKSNNSIEYLRALTIAPQEFASSLMLPMVLIFNEVLVVIMLIILLFSFYPKILLLLFISIVPVCVILIRISHVSSDEYLAIRS